MRCDQPPPSDRPDGLFRPGTGTYLKALGVTTIDGRLLDDRDGPGAPLAIVVNKNGFQAAPRPNYYFLRLTVSLLACRPKDGGPVRESEPLATPKALAALPDERLVYFRPSEAREKVAHSLITL